MYYNIYVLYIIIYYNILLCIITKKFFVEKIKSPEESLTKNLNALGD